MYKMTINIEQMTTFYLQYSTVISSKKCKNAKKTTENHRTQQIHDKNNHQNVIRLASVLAKRHTTDTLLCAVSNDHIKLVST